MNTLAKLFLQISLIVFVFGTIVKADGEHCGDAS